MVESFEVKDSDLLRYLDKGRAWYESTLRMPESIDIDPVDLFTQDRPDPSIDIIRPEQDKSFCYLNKPPNWSLICNRVSEIVGAENGVERTNCTAYPAGGVMTWHTNSNLDGWRTYLTYSYGESAFRYIDDKGEIITCRDLSNCWQLRRFEIPQEDRFWHTIASNGFRITYGFRDL